MTVNTNNVKMQRSEVTDCNYCDNHAIHPDGHYGHPLHAPRHILDPVTDETDLLNQILAVVVEVRDSQMRTEALVTEFMATMKQPGALMKMMTGAFKG